MATYKQVGYGSQGSDVKELQKLLNNNGYKLSVDGIFGSQTQKAVRDYQQKNKLAVDGIVGNNTWGALTKASSSNATSSNPTSSADTKKDTSFQYDAYKESDTVKQAEALLNQQLAQKPGEYTSQWQAQINDTIRKILNREQFSYDLNGDALYQQYKDQYVLQGQQAMMDTMGQAAMLTGGYGNSYAQTAGQQAYQAYLQQLHEIVPDLYGMALDKYNQEGQDLLNQFAVLGEQEDQDYSRYMDNMNAWLSERDYLAGRYDTERDYDYGKWADGRDFSYGQYIDDRNYQYQQDRDAVADEQWQKEFDEAKRQYDQAYALENGGSSGGGSGSGGSSNSGGGSDSGSSGGYDNEGLSANQIKNIQRSLGVEVDGKWGPASKKAAGGLSAKEAYDAWNKGQLGKPVGAVAEVSGNLGDAGKIKLVQKYLGVTQDGVWGPESRKAAGGLDFDKAWSKFVVETDYGVTSNPGSDAPGSTGGFSGTSYSEAVAYMKSHGVPNSNAAFILTKSEWARAKSSGSDRYGASDYDSYADYLADAVAYNIEVYGK